MIAIIVFLGRRWLGARIEESIKHEYARKLEEHKAHLQEQVNRSIRQMQSEFQEAVDQKATDKALFAKFLETLPSSGSIEFMDKFNMAGWSFDRKNLDQLATFQEDWRRPERQFLDEEVDKRRAHLHKLIGEYLKCLAFNTFPVKGNPDYSSVPEEWQEEQPERFNRTVKKLHDLAGKAVAAHKDLITTARQRLKC